MSNIISLYKPAYKIFEDEISSVRLTQFLYAIGEMPVAINGDKFLYFAPYRNDTEPKLIVNDNTGLWYDYVSGELGRICDLAVLTANKKERDNIPGYIVKTVNRAVDMVPEEHSTAGISGIKNIDMIPLTEFLQALGHEQPIARDDNYLLYYVPYGTNHKLVLIINSETNHWRDLKTGLHGDIYALAGVLSGTDNKNKLKKYISDKMIEPLKESEKEHAPSLRFNKGVVLSKRKHRL